MVVVSANGDSGDGGSASGEKRIEPWFYCCCFDEDKRKRKTYRRISRIEA